MAYLLEDVRAQVKAHVQDDASFLTQTEIDIFITSALYQLNKDHPYEVVKDIAGNGSKDYALPVEFEKGVSDISTVEAPAGNNPPSYTDRDDDWYIYEDPTKPAGQQMRLRFKESAPSSTQIIRVVIDTLSTISLTTSNLNQITFNALCFLAAATAFKALAARFNQSTDPTIAADTVDYGNRAQNYLFLAEKFVADYNSTVGKGQNDVPAGQAMTEADIIFSHGEDFLMHPSRSR